MQINNTKKPIGLFFYQKEIIAISYVQKHTYIYLNEETYTFKHHVKFVMNELLKPHYKTLESSITIYQKLYGKSYLVPIYVSRGQCLIPCYGWLSKSNVLLNIYAIKKMTSVSEGCQLMMRNGLKFVVLKSCRNIKKSIEKARTNQLFIR